MMDQRAHHDTGHEFWVSSGHVLLQRDAEGRLAVTDEFVKAFYARPEVMPRRKPARRNGPCMPA